jgi:hypothetical protein
VRGWVPRAPADGSPVVVWPAGPDHRASGVMPLGEEAAGIAAPQAPADTAVAWP